MIPSVSIVIPVFGDQKYLIACLDALERNTENVEVVLVDNGTGYPMDADVVIRNEENRGFGVASNQGADVASGNLLVFLNVDTEVQPDWLPPLVAAFDEDGIAIAGPRIIHPDGSLQTSGVRLWHGNGSAGGEEMKGESASRYVDGVTGACMLVRHKVFDELGQFDTDFVNGYEDSALCMSANEAGYRARYVAESTIIHHEHGSGPERWTHAHQNVATMNAKWGNR